jgi:PII-like signaling protein
MLGKEGQLLRIFIGESDRHEGLPLYEWLVRQARQRHLAGATVLRGLEGFGAHSRMHTAKILRLSQDLPIIVEIVDTKENIQSFLELVDEVIEEGIATLEDVNIHFYRGGRQKGSAAQHPSDRSP